MPRFMTPIPMRINTGAPSEIRRGSPEADIFDRQRARRYAPLRPSGSEKSARFAQRR